MFQSWKLLEIFLISNPIFKLVLSRYQSQHELPFELQGWAVRAREAILRGSFVCEYIGEVIDEKEANERRNRCEFLFSIFFHILSCYISCSWLIMFYFPCKLGRYSAEGCRYLYEIDAHINYMSKLIEGQVSYAIDATNYGNVSRYINHRWGNNFPCAFRFFTQLWFLLRRAVTYTTQKENSSFSVYVSSSPEWEMHQILNNGVQNDCNSHILVKITLIEISRVFAKYRWFDPCGVLLSAVRRIWWTIKLL